MIIVMEVTYKYDPKQTLSHHYILQSVSEWIKTALARSFEI